MDKEALRVKEEAKAKIREKSKALEAMIREKSEALEAMHAMSASLKQRVDGEILAREIDQMRKVNDFLSEEITEKSLKHSKELSDLYFEMLRVKSHALSLEAQLVVAKRP